ncbi:MAG: hypothetical protein AAGI68_13850 [Planctomycetota bacterium]
MKSIRDMPWLDQDPTSGGGGGIRGGARPKRRRLAVRLRRTGRWMNRWTGLIAVLGIVLGGGSFYAAHRLLNDFDAKKLTAFAREVDQEWFSGDRDFRELNLLYAQRASAAARVEPFGEPLVKTMEAIRTHPLVVERFPDFTWDQASADHYHTFAKGPLHSYFLRNEEIAGDWYTERRKLITEPLLQRGWNAEPPRFADLETLLPTTMRERPGIEQAITGQVARLYTDIKPPAGEATYAAAVAMAETDYMQVVREVRLAAQRYAGKLGYGSDLNRLTIAEQEVVLLGLDEYVREQDRGLWRRKQLADFSLAMIGVPEATHAYVNLCVRPFMAVRSTFEYTGMFLVVGFSMLLTYRLLMSRPAARGVRDVDPFRSADWA